MAVSPDFLPKQLTDGSVGSPPLPPDDFAQRILQFGERSAMNAVSPKGAYSSAQVMPATAADPGFGVQPAAAGSLEDAVREGIDYANALKAHYGNEQIAAAAYNAGPGTVDDWLNGTNRTGRNAAGHKLDPQTFAENIPFPETRAYVARVTGAAPRLSAPTTHANPFDQFDPPAATAASRKPNPFDQFDAPASTAPASPQANPFDQFDNAPAPAVKTAAPTPAPQTDEGLGAYQGFMHVFDRAAQGMQTLGRSAAAHPSGVPNPFGLMQEGADWLSKNAGLPDATQAANDHANFIKSQEASGKKPGAFGDFAGELAASAPAAALGPFSGGAAAGILTGDGDTPLGVSGEALGGGLLGKGGDLAMQGASRVIKPIIDPAVKLLRDKGVNLLPGQILGGAARKMEDAATSIPFLGDMIASGKNSGVRDFNRAAANEAVAPIGQTIPKGVETGHDSVRAAGDALSASYQRILPKLSVAPDQIFANNIAKISLDAQQTMPRSQFFQFRNLLQNNTVLNRLASPKAGPITGTAMKDADSQLGQIARSYSGSSVASERQFGQSLAAVQNELRQLTLRSNPQAATELAAIDKGWANLVPLESAAGKAGGTATRDAGIFSPQQYQRAVTATDTSVRDRATARGTRGGLQDFAEAGAQVLPSSINDSGTARRLLVGRILGGGIGGAEYERGGEDIRNPAVMLPAALALGAYTPAGRKLLQATITHDAGPVAGSIAAMLSRLGKLSGPVLPTLTHFQNDHAAP